MNKLKQLWFRAFPIHHPLTSVISDMRKNDVTHSTGAMWWGDGTKYTFEIKKVENDNA